MEPRIDVDSPPCGISLPSMVGSVTFSPGCHQPAFNGIKTTSELEAAKKLVLDYKAGAEPPGTTRTQVMSSMQMYKSASPRHRELQNIFGRMSFQMPGGNDDHWRYAPVLQLVPAVVFWQWFNQSFNALVNHEPKTQTRLHTHTARRSIHISHHALGTAVGLRKLVKSSSTLLQRFVPFAAVARQTL